MKALAILVVCLRAVAAQQFTVDGVVVGHLTNQPLARVLVELMPLEHEEESLDVLTNADGRFTFLRVPEGRYRLSAQKRGQIPQFFHLSKHGFATILVLDGHTKTDHLVFALREYSSITVRILDEGDEPVGAVAVELFRKATRDGESRVSLVEESYCNSSGIHRFSHLIPGTYYISAHGWSWLKDKAVYPVTFYGDTTDARAAHQITLSEGSSSEALIRLHGTDGIRVKLPNFNQTFALFVPGPGDSEIAVALSIFGKGFTQEGTDFSPDELPSKDMRDLALGNLAAGQYRLVTGDEEDPNQIRQVIDLEDGATLSLEPAAPPALIKGQVVFDTPRPKEQVQVWIGDRDGVKMTDVGADGTFKIERNSAGHVAVTVDSPSLVTTRVEAKGARMLHDQLEIVPGAQITLTVHAQSRESLATLKGFALDGGGGVADATLLLLPEELSRTNLIHTSQAESDGSFKITGVTPGRYTLVAIDDATDLAYKDDAVIRPYLAAGISLTVSSTRSGLIKVPVQRRIP